MKKQGEIHHTQESMRKRDPIKTLTILVCVVLGLSIINLSATLNLYSDSGSANPPPTPTPQDQPLKKVDVSADDDPVMGKANAPITIIEFSDFQCPFCGRFYTQTLPEIKSKYIDTGKAKLVFRDYPLPFHPEAEPAAIAAECADEQGKFWEYHDKIFENQETLNAESRLQWARDIGLDMKKFESCLNDPAIKKEVQKDSADGSAAGVQGTPSFFINGKMLVGAQPFAAFQQVIDQELKA